MWKRMFDVVKPKKERTSKKLNLGIAKKILAMKFLEYYLKCQNKEEKLLIVCRKKKLKTLGEA